jgi:hypothetical protein
MQSAPGYSTRTKFADFEYYLNTCHMRTTIHRIYDQPPTELQFRLIRTAQNLIAFRMKRNKPWSGGLHTRNPPPGTAPSFAQTCNAFMTSNNPETLNLLDMIRAAEAHRLLSQLRTSVVEKGMEDGAMQKAVQGAIADEAKAPAAPEEPEGGGGFGPSFKQPNQN